MQGSRLNTLASAPSKPLWLPAAVTIVTERWSRDGGVGTHVQASARLLAEHGVRVQVVCGEIEEAPSDQSFTLKASPALFAKHSTASELAREISGWKAPVIHLHHFHRPARILELRKFAPVVLSEHAYSMCASGVHYFRPGEECSRGHGGGCAVNLLSGGCAHTRYPRTLPRKYLNAGQALRALRLADHVICHSRAVDRHLADNAISRRSIVPLFPTLPGDLTTQPPIGRRVLFAGRAVPPKGLNVLIQAMNDIDAELQVCAAGRELERSRALAQALGNQQRIHFRGWLPAEQLRLEIAKAALVVIPSVWPEPFGLIGIEALAQGRPVVASQTGGVLDWLQHGVNGLLVPPDEPEQLAAAISSLLDDPALRERMGEQGRELVAERFSAERHLQALIGAYSEADRRWRSPAALG